MPGGGMPGGGMPGGGMPAGMGELDQKMWACENCKHKWPDTGGGTPTLVPEVQARVSRR